MSSLVGDNKRMLMATFVKPLNSLGAPLHHYHNVLVGQAANSIIITKYWYIILYSIDKTTR
jgi:hypothetical protein